MQKLDIGGLKTFNHFLSIFFPGHWNWNSLYRVYLRIIVFSLFQINECIIYSAVEKRADCTDQPLEYSNLIDAANIGETFSTIEF